MFSRKAETGITAREQMRRECKRNHEAKKGAIPTPLMNDAHERRFANMNGVIMPV